MFTGLVIFTAQKQFMSFSYPKKEKLKSRTVIDLIFTKGKSVSKYPLRLAFIEIENKSDIPTINFGVSVSKKYFKKAVDRNYIKRVLRECYRLNKHLIQDNAQKSYAMMLLYQSKELANFHEINAKAVLLFEKFISATAKKDD